MLHFIISVSLIWMNAAIEYELVVGDSYNTGVPGGQMFMVEAAAKDITTDAFTFHFNGGGTTEYTFRVYYKVGPFVDDRLNEGAWTVACEGKTPASTWDPVNSVWLGANTGQCNILIPAGSRYSIYIVGIDRGSVTQKICSGSSCSQTFDDVIASDDYLTAYMGLGLHELFGNGYLDTYYVDPDVTIFYTVDANPSPTTAPTTAAPTQPVAVPMCCVARGGPAIWDGVCDAMDSRRKCNLIYDGQSNKKCKYQECGSEKEEMVLMNNMDGWMNIISSQNINKTADGNGYYSSEMLGYAILASLAICLMMFMYRKCKQLKIMDDTSPLLAHNNSV